MYVCNLLCYLNIMYDSVNVNLNHELHYAIEELFM